jgi:hypothetical protein
MRTVQKSITGCSFTGPMIIKTCETTFVELRGAFATLSLIGDPLLHRTKRKKADDRNERPPIRTPLEENKPSQDE